MLVFGTEEESPEGSLFMLSLEQLRKLHPRPEEVTDKELQELGSAMAGLAQLAFDVYWHEKSGSKNPVGLFPPKEQGDTLTLWSKDQKQE